MRRGFAALVVACCLGLGGTAAVGVTSATAGATLAGGAPAHAAYCVYGRIGGVTKCLRAGEYCAHRYQRQYLRYGFTCNKLDYRGDWHLERA
jgi:hypothetical protein